jgi:ketosteroid isomerase-like protein
VVRSLMAAFERGDVDAQLTLLAPDVEIVEWPDAPDPRTFRGHAGARRAREAWAEVWEWLRSDVEEVAEAGDRVVVCGRTHAKGKGSAVEVDVEAFNVYTLRDGRVTRIELFTSKGPAMRAAGLTEAAIESDEAR